MGSLLNGHEYESISFLDKRKFFLNSLLKNCDYQVTWSENKSKYVPYGTKNVSYVPEFQLYTLDGDSLSEPEFFDGFNFNPNWNTRDILLDEAVIEIEHKTDLNLNWLGTMETIWNLQKEKIHFAVFYAEGMRSPHIHIYGLFKDVQDWAEKEMAMAVFCRKIIPFEFFHLADRNLWGQHTIALEFSKHYRTGNMLKLLYEYVPEVRL